jgi:hypothetical protein
VLVLVLVLVLELGEGHHCSRGTVCLHPVSNQRGISAFPELSCYAA